VDIGPTTGARTTLNGRESPVTGRFPGSLRLADQTPPPATGATCSFRTSWSASPTCAARWVATSYEADVAVVDKLPLGPGGELADALEALSSLPRCRVVLGLRLIDDTPERMRREWGPDMRAAIERYYDEILVYGPASSPDAIRSAGWTDFAVPVHRVGYLGWPMSQEPASDLPAGYLLGTVGGGHDGFRLLEAVLEAIRLEPLRCPAVVITGPLMATGEVAALRALATGIDAQVAEFRGDMERVLAGARGRAHGRLQHGRGDAARPAAGPDGAAHAPERGAARASARDRRAAARLVRHAAPGSADAADDANCARTASDIG
jgi:hypothetical protein